MDAQGEKKETKPADDGAAAGAVAPVATIRPPCQMVGLPSHGLVHKGGHGHRPFMPPPQFIPEFMHQIPMLPGSRSFEVTFRWNFGDDYDDDYEYNHNHHVHHYRHGRGFGRAPPSHGPFRHVGPPPTAARYVAPLLMSAMYQQYGPPDPCLYQDSFDCNYPYDMSHPAADFGGRFYY
ncbi:OLC1v1008337C1 [Oldenlandia corymbosa var. corymbosa]|uniref:OLC1v1008337C1 n=1 Tax=Oldenlandia corymbosa var. corymbosa TaxID=529605 RepID=A0AAV1DLC4_OLDCO|nr:OLC1v1008337C1 [Oldenlandia corymbosa var. corymbosa]